MKTRSDFAFICINRANCTYKSGCPFVRLALLFLLLPARGRWRAASVHAFKDISVLIVCVSLTLTLSTKFSIFALKMGMVPKHSAAQAHEYLFVAGVVFKSSWSSGCCSCYRHDRGCCRGKA